MFEDEVNAVANVVLPALKVRRNTATPIAKLPNEILLLIFDHCQRSTMDDLLRRLGESDGRWDYPTYPSCLPYSKITLARTTCSQVCHWWRNIVLGTGSLWKDVLADFGPKAFETMFLLSRSTPQVHFCGHFAESLWSSPRHGGTIAVDFSRTSAMSLRAHCYCVLKGFLNSFHISAPILELIDLGDSPMARRIKLLNVPLAWGRTGPLYHLTQLDVNTPALEVLKLDYCFLEDDHPLRPSIEVTALPHLRFLDCHLEERDCLYLFRYLQFPTCTRIRLTCQYQNMNEESAIFIINRAFGRFREMLNDDEPNGILGCSSGYEMHIVVHSTTDDALMRTLFSREGDSKEKDVDLIFCGQSNEDKETRIHYAACNALPASFVHTLCVVYCRSDQVWRSHALRFPHILATNLDAWSFEWGLGNLLLPLGPAAGPVVLLPELRWLRVQEGVSLNTWRTHLFRLFGRGGHRSVGGWSVSP
ncbi:hypothetical protein BC834DRAFT_970599 [Gloeopeniophorella convolvens]|nr:hypothetical protein BC834DRAFT_970599 [Gloeopeniophorella convolvens]